MKTLVSRLFGTVPLDGSDAYLVLENEIGGRRMERSLFVASSLHGASSQQRSASELLARAGAMLDDAEALDRRARAALATTFDDPSDATVRDFVDFHRSELPVEMQTDLFGPSGAPSEPREVLGHLALVGFALHARDDGFALVMDYSLGKHVTDELLAVKLDVEGMVLQVSHES